MELGVLIQEAHLGHSLDVHIVAFTLLDNIVQLLSAVLETFHIGVSVTKQGDGFLNLSQSDADLSLLGLPHG